MTYKNATYNICYLKNKKIVADISKKILKNALFIQTWDDGKTLDYMGFIQYYYGIDYNQVFIKSIAYLKDCKKIALMLC